MIIRLLITIFMAWFINAIINYLSDTLPKYRSFVLPTCEICTNKVPLLNYFNGKGCSTCGYLKLLRFWITGVFLLVFLVFEIVIVNNNIQDIVVNSIVYSMLILITIIDIEHHLILKQISIACAIMFGGIGLINHGTMDTILGGLTGFGIMFLLFIFGYWYSRSISRKRGIELEEGMGFGDVALVSVCGLLLGWPGVIAAIVLAILLGGLWSICLIVFTWITKKDNVLMRYIAYAPFITIATGVLWLIR
jgi:prepilin signal peptidase PulO-like enzyme (type II secretory pathway)